MRIYAVTFKSNSAISNAVKTSKLLENSGFKKTENGYYRFLLSEVDELKAAKANEDFDNMEEEVGDVMFDTIMLADHYGVDPEKALNRTNTKIKTRLKKAQELAEKPLITYPMHTRLEYWDKAKRELSN